MTKPVDLLFTVESKLREQKLCPFCKKDIGEFRNDLSRKEYKISGLCQKCQDSVFGVD